MERKVKYNLAFKLECVRKCIRKTPVNTLGFSSGRFSESLLDKWIFDYENQGILGLQPKKNQQYSAGFKLSLINLIKKEHLSLREALVKFKLPSESVIVKWQETVFITFNFKIKKINTKKLKY